MRRIGFVCKVSRSKAFRSAIYVPLISNEQSIGGIFLYRRIVSPFTDEDVALVETFAEQAVIAIENVRQFKALQARTEEVQNLNAGLENRVAEQVAGDRTHKPLEAVPVALRRRGSGIVRPKKRYCGHTVP